MKKGFALIIIYYKMESKNEFKKLILKFVHVIILMI